jgi:capsular polysaccharide transport system permease protein
MLVGIFRVIIALMLRNIRTRFFGHGLGFLIAIAWPLVHIGILLGIRSFGDRVAPYGDNLTLFFATGLVPFMVFQYVSRYTMISVQQTRPLLAFPVVKITDLLFAGAILEMFASLCSVTVLALCLMAFGIDLRPALPTQAALALGVAALLGFSFGIVNTLIFMAAPIWMTGYALIQICLYLGSGIFFLPSGLPPTVRYYASFLPTMQIVEWMRSAYYDGYASVLDKSYVVTFAVATICIGLIIERVFRGRFLVKT